MSVKSRVTVPVGSVLMSERYDANGTSTTALGWYLSERARRGAKDVMESRYGAEA